MPPSASPEAGSLQKKPGIPSRFQPTAEERATIFKRYVKDGESTVAISKDYQYCIPNHVCAIVREMGGEIRRRGCYAKLTPEHIKYACKEYECGTSIRSIAQKLGVSKTAIQQLLFKRKIKRHARTLRRADGHLPYNEKGEFIP